MTAFISSEMMMRKRLNRVEKTDGVKKKGKMSKTGNEEDLKTNGEKKYTGKELNVLIVCMTTALTTTFAGSCLNLAVPFIEAEFHMGATAVGWIVTAYMLVTAALSVPMGSISARIGIQKGLMIGIAIFAVSSLAAIFSLSGTMVIFMRAVQGVGAAFLFATNMAIVVLTFPREKSGEALGLMTAAIYTGLSLGPVLGGLLIHYLGWRSLFAVMSVISIVAFAVAVKKLEWRNEERGPSHGLDIRGTLLYMTGIVAAIYGLSEVSVSAYGWMFLAGGCVLLAIFAIAEMHTGDPVVKISIFVHNKIFTLSNITALLNYSAIFTISYLLSIYLQVIKGYSSQAAGLMLAAQPLVMVVLSPLTGRLSDRVASWKLVTLGMGICVGVLFVLSRLTLHSPLWIVIAMLAAAGTGVAFFSSPNTNQIMSSVGAADKTFASAILSTMRTIGQTTGMAVVTVIAGMYLGNESLAAAPPAMLVKTVQVCFLVSTVLCIAGTIMSTTRKAVQKS